MYEVVIDLGAAAICFLGSCYPALVGANTPTGAFQLKHYTTDAPGYGGDLLVFKEDDTSVWAIHRVINVPGQNRPERLKKDDPKERRFITAGCINLEPEVYDKLAECCSNSPMIIK